TRIGKTRGEGATYLVFHDFWDSGNLEEGLEGGYRIDGIRLPQLVQFLARNEMPDEGCCFSHDMQALQPVLFPKGKRAKTRENALIFALRDEPHDDAPWLIFGDWLEEEGRKESVGALLLKGAFERVCRLEPEDLPSGCDPKKSSIQVAEHVAVLCRHVGCWSPGADMYHQWFFFDDLWASAHPDLANTILRYAKRWDVLTP